MICKNCGLEVIGENAVFCNNCLRPLESEPADVSSESEQVYMDLDQSKSDSIAESEEDSLDVADPIDFIMNQSNYETDEPDKGKPGSGTPMETISSKDDAGDKFGALDIQHDMGSSMAPESYGASVKTETEKPPVTPPSQGGPGGTQSHTPIFESDSGESLTATEKIKASEIKGEIKPASAEENPFESKKPVDNPFESKKSTESSLEANKPEVNPFDSKKSTESPFESEKSEENPFESKKPAKKPAEAHDSTEQSFEPSFSVDLPKVARSKGVVLLSGETLTFTGGTKIFPGDEVQVGDRVYEVRPKPKNNNLLYGIIGGAAAILVIAVLIFGGFLSFGGGKLIGVLMGDGGYPLSGQVIRVVEANKTSTTNEAGFFIFEGLNSGLYTVQYLVDGEMVSEERIAVVDNEATTITLYETQSESSAPDTPQARTPKPAVTTQTNEKTQDKALGVVKLSLSPSDATAFLDDKPMGKGSNSYNLKPGKYVLSIKKRGYETQSRNITVKDGKTASYQFALKKPSKSRTKTDGELAYENEAAGNYHEALRYYDKILSKNSKDVGAIMGKARCYRGQNLTDKAVTYYTQAAGIAGNKGDVATQIDALSAIIEIRPNTMTAYSGRGDVYYSQKQYLKAANDYESVVQMDKRNLGIIYKLGNSYYYAHKYANALAAYQAAEELNFADPKAQVCQAKTYLMMGDQKNMKKAYERCKEFTTYAARLEFKSDPDWQKVLDALGVSE